MSCWYVETNGVMCKHRFYCIVVVVLFAPPPPHPHPTHPHPQVLDEAVFYIVANINPDGSWRGHLRTNSDGKNLNRCWLNPTMDDVPEVYAVLRKMDEVGVDAFIDVHGTCVVCGCKCAGVE